MTTPADLPVATALGLVYHRNALIFAEGLMEMDANRKIPGVFLEDVACKSISVNLLSTDDAKIQREFIHFRKSKN